MTPARPRPRHARRHDTAARAGYYSCSAVLLASAILIAADPGRALIGVITGAAAVVCGLACRAYLHGGQQQ